MSHPVPRPVLTIYRRPACHLCDEAEVMLATELEARAGRGELTPSVRGVDVATEPELEARYGARVPVFAVGDQELGPVLSPRQVRTFLGRILPVPV